ncbi:MAG: helix-turn-helix domain-containing protein [Acidilobus sp.]
MSAYVHLLSKDARKRIIELLSSSRGVRRLADELGVTPAAVSKYLRGTTHPSDRVIAKAIELATPEEAAEISKIIAEVLLEGVNDYVRWSVERGVVYPKVSMRLSELAARAGLASLSSRRAVEAIDARA